MDNPKKDRLPSGSPIPGSRLYRLYCFRCDEPMRVAFGAVQRRMPVFCEDCEPRPLKGHAATKDDEAPWQANAIRHLEG